MIKKSPELITIFLIVFVDVLGFTIILPLLPFYSEALGATPFQVGLLVSVFGICQLISGPILGQLSDRVGRRPVLLLSQLGTLAGFVMLALSRKLWMIFLARTLDGITAGNITVAQAYIADVTPLQQRTRAMGMIGAAFGLGFLIGPAISALLAQYGHSAPIWAACFLSFVSICGSYFFLKEKRILETVKPARQSKKERYRELLAKNEVKRYYLGHLAFGFSFSIFTSGLALYCERCLHWSGHPFQAREVGFLLTYSGMINLTIQVRLIGRLVAKFGELNLVRFGFASGAIGLSVVALSHSLPMFIFGLTLNSVGSALIRPAVSGLISQAISPKHQGFAIGFGQTLFSIAQILGPIWSGTLITGSHFLGYAFSAAFASLLGFLVFVPKINAAPKYIPEEGVDFA